MIFIFHLCDFLLFTIVIFTFHSGDFICSVYTLINVILLSPIENIAGLEFLFSLNRKIYVWSVWRRMCKHSDDGNILKHSLFIGLSTKNKTLQELRNRPNWAKNSLIEIYTK